MSKASENNDVLALGNVGDTVLTRTAAGEVSAGKSAYAADGAFKAASFSSTGPVSGTAASYTSDSVIGANGEGFKIQSVSELITLAVAATSTSVALLLPANSWIVGVVGRVVTTTTTTATLSIGDGTTSARFGSGIAIAAGTKFGENFSIFNPANTNAQGAVQAAAANIVITPNAQPGDALGRVRVTVFYATLTAPSS